MATYRFKPLPMKFNGCLCETGCGRQMQVYCVDAEKWGDDPGSFVCRNCVPANAIEYGPRDDMFREFRPAA